MDKNKILDVAAKLVAKGSYDKAIKEYAKILEGDPKDGRVLHKLGELYEKKNDHRQAAAYFTRVADGYAADGFSMKAIALYKKVLKLDPNLIEVNLKLAELHQQHQLMTEAMSYYQAVANHHDRAGNVRASLDILKKMVELDPENVTSRVKLGEMFAREGMSAEAAHELRRAAEHLKRNQRMDDWARVAERLSALEPQDIALARELANEFLAKGDQKKALARLQLCFKADPHDVQTLTLLAQAFFGLGQTTKTISVYKELAKIHADRGRAGEAERIWAKIADLDPRDPELAARAAPHPPAPSYAPSPSYAPAPSYAPEPQAPHPEPARPAAPQGPLSRDQIAKLLTETDVYVKYGLHDKALEHLRRIFATEPENLDAHEKAFAIYSAAGNAPAAFDQLLNVLRLCTRQRDARRAQPYLAQLMQQAPGHPELPAFLQTLGAPALAQGGYAAEETLAEDAILVDSGDEDVIVADDEDAPSMDQDLALTAAGAPEADDVFDDPALSAEPIPDVEIEDDVVAVAAERDDAWEEPIEGEVLEPAAEECDEAEFFIEQGLFDEARDVLETVQIAFPGHARAEALMARLEEVSGAPPDRAVSNGAADPEVAKDAFDLAAELADEVEEMDEDSFVSNTDEYQVSVEQVFTEFKRGIERIVKPEDVDTHYDLGIAYKEMGLVDDAIGEFLVAREGCVGKKKEVDCLTMLGLLHAQKGDLRGAIEAFKAALANDQAPPESARGLRFELASAWEQAGNARRALHHYRVVASGDPNFRDVSERLERLGHLSPEDDPLPQRGQKNGAARAAVPARPGGKAGKVGYV